MYRKKELFVIVFVQIAITLVLLSAKPNTGDVKPIYTNPTSVGPGFSPYRR